MPPTAARTSRRVAKQPVEVLPEDQPAARKTIAKKPSPPAKPKAAKATAAPPPAKASTKAKGKMPAKPETPAMPMDHLNFIGQVHPQSVAKLLAISDDSNECNEKRVWQATPKFVDGGVEGMYIVTQWRADGVAKSEVDRGPHVFMQPESLPTGRHLKAWTKFVDPYAKARFVAEVADNKPLPNYGPALDYWVKHVLDPSDLRRADRELLYATRKHHSNKHGDDLNNDLWKPYMPHQA